MLIVKFYYTIIWFVAVTIIPIFERILKVKSSFDLYTISGYSGFLVLGVLLSKLTLTERIAKIAFVVFLINTSITIYGTYWLTKINNGIFNSYFYNFKSPTVIFAASSLFLIIKFASEKKIVNKKNSFCKREIISTLSSLSFGVYLIHPFTMMVISKFFPLPTIYPTLDIINISLLTLILSFAFVYILNKIPVVRKIVN
jgi:surface polysaccharide O-acyltransferase-like enzyme